MAKKDDENKKPKGKGKGKGGKKKPAYDTKKKFDELNKRLQQYAGVVNNLYEGLEAAVANIALSTGITALETVSQFHFASYPQAREAFHRTVNTYLSNLAFVIDRGTRAEWEKAEADHDAFVNSIMRQYGRGAKDEAQKYLNHRTEARDMFLRQQRDGKHGWSMRVWNLQTQIQQEMELSISAAIADGTSASSLATQMKQYLNEPDRLFRRVRNEYGELVLSKNAAAYHPGPGIYRSSRANAMRLCRTEINTAYRNADQERYQQEDFVVGYEIKLSGAHPAPDICDELAGKYPKTFKWSGWHPHDLCFLVPILKTEEEFFADDGTPSKNEVTDVPDAFKQYMAENAERIEAARQRGTLPFWVKDNYQIGKNGGYRPLFGVERSAEAAEKAKLITSRKAEYENLKADSNYKDVEFNPETGAVKATHVGHGHDKPTKDLFNNTLSGDDLELECQQKLFKEGNSIVLLGESDNVDGRRHVDAVLNGDYMEIKSITKNKDHYMNAFKAKNKQLHDWNKQNPTKKSDIVCFYFHDPSFYSEEKVKLSLPKTLEYYAKEGQEKEIAIKRILCVFNGDKPSVEIRL